MANHINNPIVISVKSLPHTGGMAKATFHVVKIEVAASVTGGMGIMSPMSQSTIGGEALSFDISSALRAAADTLSFQPTMLNIPSVTYDVQMYEEYMLDGALKTTTKTLVTAGAAYLGGYTDYERITGTKPTGFSRKPLSSPETVAVGDIFLSPPQGDSSSPSVATARIINEGLQTVGAGNTVYAVPANRNRYQFRFVNGLGAMETVSVESYVDESVNINTEQFVVSRPETMDSTDGITHTRIEKSLDIEQWKFSSGPLNRAWRKWFVHEFLMSKRVWLLCPDASVLAGTWLPVLIVPEETTPIINLQNTDIPTIEFTVKMNFNG